MSRTSTKISTVKEDYFVCIHWDGNTWRWDGDRKNCLEYNKKYFLAPRNLFVKFIAAAAAVTNGRVMYVRSTYTQNQTSPSKDDRFDHHERYYQLCLTDCQLYI